MADELRWTALILSDLHFGSHLLREAEIPPLQFPWWKHMLAPAIRRYMETRCKAHDIAIVMQLPLYLKRLLGQLRREEGFKKQEFDFYFFLGDLSTYANGASYSFLRDYISNRTYVASGLTRISALNIPTDKIVMIPGNHDKMLRRNLDIFGRELATPLGLPNGPEPGHSFFNCTPTRAYGVSLHPGRSKRICVD
jgi:3',5'-cyclic AMP phosphodiesterase CpdA